VQAAPSEARLRALDDPAHRLHHKTDKTDDPPKTDDPKTDDPKTDDPKTDDPKTDPAKKDPVAVKKTGTDDTKDPDKKDPPKALATYSARLGVGLCASCCRS
jgi:dipeptidase